MSNRTRAVLALLYSVALVALGFWAGWTVKPAVTIRESHLKMQPVAVTHYRDTTIEVHHRPTTIIERAPAVRVITNRDTVTRFVMQPSRYTTTLNDNGDTVEVAHTVINADDTDFDARWRHAPDTARTIRDSVVVELVDERLWTVAGSVRGGIDRDGAWHDPALGLGVTLAPPSLPWRVTVGAEARVYDSRFTTALVARVDYAFLRF
jgi:hypothetical protein